MSRRADDLAAALDLEPLVPEGGRYRRTHLDGGSSAILYLLTAPEFSVIHRLPVTEIYHWHAGAPLRMLLLGPGGQIREPVLGTDVAAGQLPQAVVPAGTWQGSSPDGDWTLLGTTCAPPFDWSGFELGDRATLTATHPGARVRIAELTTVRGNQR